jgi:CheY-specific phosphatase CheX/CheY-like chemotaxis protein
MASNRTILIVDDEPDIVEIVTDSFKGLGNYTFVTAGDGLDAYRKARNQEFALICTDFKMPRLSGAALISALREHGPNSKTPVIVLSGFHEAAQADCSKLGLSADLLFLGKPFQQEQLVAAARGFLSGAETATSAPVSALPKAAETAPKLDVDFINPFIDAVIKTMTTMAQVKNIAVEKVRALKNNEALLADITGCISIVAPLFTGSVSVSFPQETFLNLVSGMLGETYTQFTPEIEDAAAELTNIIYGDAKVKLNGKGYRMDKAIPSIIRGPGHSIRSDSRVPALVVQFVSTAGPFFVSFVLEAKK